MIKGNLFLKCLVYSIVCAVCLFLLECQGPIPSIPTWVRIFGGTSDDRAYSARETSDGGFILAGMTWSFGAGGEDMYLVRTDNGGNELWASTFGGSNSDYAFFVQQTSDGGFILAGSTWSFGAGLEGMYLVRTDSAGSALWPRTYGGIEGDCAYSVQQTSDGGFILAGETGSFGAGGDDMYAVRTDSAGNVEWARTFGGIFDDLASSVQQTSDGGFILAGVTWSFGAGREDMYLVRTDSAGDELWATTFGGSSSEVAYSVQQTSDGGFILAGYTYSFGAGSGDMYLVRTDVDGNELWASTFGGIDRDHAASVQQTSDGGYILAGWTESLGAGAYDMYLVRTDSDGNELWASTFGGSDDDYAYSVQETSDGGFILAGYTGSFGAGDDDMYLVKTDSNGNGPSVPSP